MRINNRLCIVATLMVGLGALDVAAAPITWRASGQISTVVDPLAALTAIPVGTPWTLDITFDPATAGTLLGSCSTPSYHYDSAITAARFEIGSFVYENSGGDIYTNADHPAIGCSTPLGGPGLVQFEWEQGWTTVAGGPDLNLGLGLLLASYNDVNAVDGSLPLVPALSLTQSALAGLEWNSWLGGGPLHSQFTSGFTPGELPAHVPVPEPSTWFLVASGATWLARRRRRRT